MARILSRGPRGSAGRLHYNKQLQTAIHNFMKITTTQLRKIIREEAQLLMEDPEDPATMKAEPGAQRASNVLTTIEGSSNLMHKMQSLAMANKKDEITALFQGLLDVMHDANPRLSTSNIVSALRTVTATEKDPEKPKTSTA